MKQRKKRAPALDPSDQSLANIFTHLPIPFPSEVSIRIAEEELIFVRFTLREKQIGSWVAEGKRDSEIANIVGVGVQTVYTHMKSLLEKTGLENRNAFIAWVWRLRVNACLTTTSRTKRVTYK